MTIQIKKRIERFYEDSDGNAVWVMYEDTNDYIHYRDIGYIGDRQRMLSQPFYKEYRISEMQADSTLAKNILRC